MKTIVALADANSFYASCEKVFDARLKGKPVVVLSNNDGCIVARSPEAKALGIEMGAPFFKVENQLIKHRVRVFSSNYALYGDMSARVMAGLSEFAPNLEIYSVDEAFMDLSGFAHLNLTEYCRSIQQTIYRWTGLPIALGVGTTKTLAKIANNRAKKVLENSGVFDLTALDAEPILAKVAVEDVWGVGRQYAKSLRANGIETALHLRDANQAWIKQKFGVVLLRTVLELQGFACIPLELCPQPRKSIIVSRSFGRPIELLSELQEAIATYSTRAAEKLRREKLAANILTVLVMTNRFKDTPQYNNSVTIALPVGTNDTAELIHYALKGTAAIYQSGYQFKKAGVMMLDLIPKNVFQPNLFDRKDRERSQKLMETMDLINSKFGAGTVQFAAAGLSKPWQMRTAMRSSCYTTRWDELMVVKAV